MSHPSLPPARPHLKSLVVLSAMAGSTIVTYVALLLAGDLNPDSGVARSMFVIIIVLIVAAVAVDRRLNTTQIKDHIDRRVVEAACRMDHRLNMIGNAMVEHGIQLDAITGEIPRVRPLIVACNHGPNPVGRASVSGGLDPTVLEMGDRIARRLQGD